MWENIDIDRHYTGVFQILDESILQLFHKARADRYQQHTGQSMKKDRFTRTCLFVCANSSTYWNLSYCFDLSIYHFRNSSMYRLFGVIISISTVGFCLAYSFNNASKLNLLSK